MKVSAEKNKQMRFHIKKGDNVMVISGDESGKSGKVLTVNKKKAAVTIEKVNFIKRHVRPGHPMAPQGGIIEREGAVKISKLMLVCPRCSKPSRVKNEKGGKGKSSRVCVKCGEQID
jgi:large subunit ribosomal protein L24